MTSSQRHRRYRPTCVSAAGQLMTAGWSRILEYHQYTYGYEGHGTRPAWQDRQCITETVLGRGQIPVFTRIQKYIIVTTFQLSEIGDKIPQHSIHTQSICVNTTIDNYRSQNCQLKPINQSQSAQPQHQFAKPTSRIRLHIALFNTTVLDTLYNPIHHQDISILSNPRRHLL